MSVGPDTPPAPAPRAPGRCYVCEGLMPRGQLLCPRCVELVRRLAELETRRLSGRWRP